MSGNDEVSHYYADEDRAQRNTVALYNVDYVVEAHLTMTSRAGTSDNMTKFVDMFRRRVEKGQHSHQPCFGCREFPAYVEPPPASVEPVDDSRDLGHMLWDIDYSTASATPPFLPGGTGAWRPSCPE